MNSFEFLKNVFSPFVDEEDWTPKRKQISPPFSPMTDAYDLKRSISLAHNFAMFIPQWTSQETSDYTLSITPAISFFIRGAKPWVGSYNIHRSLHTSPEVPKICGKNEHETGGVLKTNKILFTTDSLSSVNRTQNWLARRDNYGNKSLLLKQVSGVDCPNLS